MESKVLQKRTERRKAPTVEVFTDSAWRESDRSEQWHGLCVPVLLEFLVKNQRDMKICPQCRVQLDIRMDSSSARLHDSAR